MPTKAVRWCREQALRYRPSPTEPRPSAALLFFRGGCQPRKSPAFRLKRAAYPHWRPTPCSQDRQPPAHVGGGHRRKGGGGTPPSAYKRPTEEEGAGATCPHPQRWETTRDNLLYFPSGQSGRGGSMPHRTDTPHSLANATRRPTPKAMEPRPTAESRAGSPYPPSELRVRRCPRPRARDSHAGGGAKTRPRTHNDLRRHPHPSPLAGRGGGRKAQGEGRGP